MSRRVCMFGALRLEQDERPVTLGGKLASLCAYLLLHPQPHPREQLADLLSPDAPPERAARNLSALLYRLRQTLGSDWLEADEERIALRVVPDLWVDAWEFERLAASGDLEDQRRAVALYRDDLLPDIYDDWILPRRVALREEFLLCLARLGEQAEQAQDSARAFEYFHRFAFADPLNEEAQRGLMRVYARTGRHAAAQQQYSQLVKTLADELGVEPLPETRTLAESIRIERGAQTVALKPFVGRMQERARLLALVERAQNGRGGFVLLEGEAGIGKTRLLENLAEGAAWRGLTVVWGRARELTGLTPFMPLDQALRAACAGPRAEQLQARLAPPFVETLAGLEPRLRAKLPTRIANLPSLEDALAQGLCMLADIAPHLFLLDDVQWADASFWDAILKLAPLIETRRLLVVLGYRGDDLRADDVAWRVLRGLDRESAPPRIALTGLSESECVELAGALGQALDQISARVLRQRTNGNPLFAAQILSEGGESDHASYKELFERRLARLDRAARASLEAGAVLGREFTHGAWQSLAGESVLESIPALIAKGLIHESESGYLFDHDLARETIYKDIETGRLRNLHRRAGEILAQERAEAGALAFHFEQAGDWREAARLYREAGERAEKVHAFASATEYFTRALDLLPRDGNDSSVKTERLALLSHRQGMLGILEHVPQRRADVEEIERIASSVGDAASLALALEARISFYQKNLDERALRASAEKALALARELDDRAMQARILFAFGNALGEVLGHAVEAIGVMQEAAGLAERLADYALASRAHSVLAFFQGMSGRCKDARQSILHALEWIEAHEELAPWRAEALHELANIHFQLAEWEAAYRTERAVLEQTEQTQNQMGVLAALWQLARIATAMGQYKDALQFTERRQALRSQAGELQDSYVLFTDAHTQKGDLVRAEQALRAGHPNFETAQGRFLQMILVVQGRLLLAQNRPAEALVPLERAVRAWQGETQTHELLPPLLHALAALRCGKGEAARASLELAEQVRVKGEAARFDILLHAVRHEVAGDVESLRAARAEIQRQAALFTDENLRADFLTNVALHREIEAQWRTLHPTPERVTVRLACADAPLGRALTEADFVSIAWTVDAGEEDADLLRREGKVALRRHRLNRLIREAREQNAAPTDSDLARALGVNTRTIERDAASLRAAGQKTKTRKRG